MQITRIHELPENERPREKMAMKGAHSLSDAELLAIFIRTGTRGRNAIAVAKELLDAQTNLAGLARCSIREIINSTPGIGIAKATELSAAFELGKRLARGMTKRPKLQTPESIYEFIGIEMQAFRHEVLKVILLDTKYQFIRTEDISIGSINESIAHPREIFRPALIHSAFGIVVVHNHPSGDPTPSHADRQLTLRLRNAATLLGIELVDHIIIGLPTNEAKPYTSFRELHFI